MAVARTKEKVEAVREDILRVCNRVFLREGYEKVTMKMLAEEAGYTTGKIYSNFTGKPEILKELGRRYVAISEKHVGALTEEKGTEAFLLSQVLGLEVARINESARKLFLSAYREDEVFADITSIVSGSIGSTTVELRKKAVLLNSLFYGALQLAGDMKESDWKKNMKLYLEGLEAIFGVSDSGEMNKSILGRKTAIHEEAYKMVVEMMGL